MTFQMLFIAGVFVAISLPALAQPTDPSLDPEGTTVPIGTEILLLAGGA